MLGINIWGSRGSVSVSGPSFVRHGGATTCVEITLGRERIIIDCGTGLADLGRQWGGRSNHAILLQSHFHWDHLQGFPFFLPFYNPKFSARLFAAEREGTHFKGALDTQMCPPRFPVGLDVLGADLVFGTLPSKGEGRFGAFEVSWAEMKHPSGSTAFKVSDGQNSIVVSGDVEAGLGCEAALTELCQGADVLVMDSQYLPEDYSSKRGFGHSTFEDAVRVAHNAGVRHLLLTHHDPSHDDHQLDSKLSRARAKAWDLAGQDLFVSNAHDGLQLKVGSNVSNTKKSTGGSADESPGGYGQSPSCRHF